MSSGMESGEIMEEAAAEPARGDAFRDNPPPSQLSSEDAAAGGGAPSVPPEAPPATNAPPDEQPSAPKPPRPLYDGVRMPYFFREDSFELFREMDVREDDIFLSSGVKMGTTWVTKILNGLKDYDNEGNLKAGIDDSLPNRKFQTYPEALPPTREIERRDIEQGKSIVKHFGDFTLDELMDQPSPRLISTHLFGEQFLPKRLFDQPDEEDDDSIVSNGYHNIVKGKGRLVVVVRNLKDALVSLHHFRGVPEDGWYGNEHGPGSFRRWIDLEDCQNSYGSAFHWVKASADAVDAIGPERALVVYYEALQSNFAAQLRRINNFLGLPRLSAAKERAITHACSAKTMKKTSSSIIRKGVVRDWTNYLDEEQWDDVDRTFNKVLNGVALAEPLRFYQFKEVPGMPPLSLGDCDLTTDPRSWPPYLLVTLQNGMIVPDARPSVAFNCTSNAAASTQFRSTIRPGRYLRLDETGKDGSPRFHIFVAGACPVASSVAAARTLLGLEQIISMDVADGQSGAGWVYLHGAICSPWKEGEGPFWLHQAYQLADPLCTAHISAPVLWDTLSRKIVSIDAWEIMKLLSEAASDLGLCSCPKDVLDAIAKQGDNNNVPTLFPDNMKQDIDQAFTNTVQPLLDTVFGAGFLYLENGGAETEQVLDERSEVLALLEELEEALDSRRFLLGNSLTGVDVVLAFCLLQFDACYWESFQLKMSVAYKGPILTSDAYPHLKAYARRMYRLVQPALHFESSRQIFQLRGAIEFTRQSYSSSAVAKQASDDTNQEALTDLQAIVAALEMHWRKL